MESTHVEERPSLKEDYERWHKASRASPDDRLPSLLLRSIRKHSTRGILLDVACGAGDWIADCERNGVAGYYCGIDISMTALRKAKANTLSSDFVVADGQRLPFRDSSIDVITCLGSLEHFPDSSAGVREMSRLMKGDALSIIMVPNAYFLGHIYLVYKTGEPPDEGGQQFSETFATRGQWSRRLGENGLRVTKCVKYNHIGTVSRKVSSMTRVLYNLLISPVLPINLSYAFIFECGKGSKARDAEHSG